MVLTAAQMTTFFEHAEQMGIPHTTVVQLCSKGIDVDADLADFDKDSLQQLADNLRRPGGRVPDPNPGGPPGATIPTPPFVFGAKSQKCITVACDLVRFYTTVGCDLTAANLQWSTIMKNFKIQWMALKERKGDDSPDNPQDINGQKPFRTFLTGRLETAISHWRTSFVMNPIQKQLLCPLLLANHIPLSMDPLRLSS